MYPPPAGPELTELQARELDDTFLASDPFKYFCSRISSLLTWHERAPLASTPLPPPDSGSVRAEFNQYLQRAAADGPFDELDVHAQVAADALAVRHHAAEALLRFAHVRLAPPANTQVRCLWGELAAGPTHIADVLRGLNAAAQEADASERALRALVEPKSREAARRSSDITGACNVLLAWLEHAANLMSPAEIDLHAAHNKVKHGLAVRARSDMRVSFVTTPPRADGTVPLSAFTGPGVLDIFDQPVLEFLTRDQKVDGHRQGLEITQLRLKPSAVLAEAYMIAMAHGVLFHVAGVEHFAGRDDLQDFQAPAPHPGYPVGGPRPQDIDAHTPLGMRFPLTTPPGGGQAKRRAGIGFRDHFLDLQLDHANRSRARVVDDD
ncbi:hypothetical protein [Nocardioides zeae]|uniref:Uncharacterized protein n=1 Tax=Nocardioides zeae TaxID=1457234 RepID=A0AAJ1U211_9ACTN|nr:hypothetical protein [Nocardioides zeae]MDQ1106621.1 hypothetical protein [Nocardioides zeae]